MIEAGNMGEYYIKNSSSDYVAHFGFSSSGRKKGYEVKNHKYVSRVQTKNGYRYFYSTQEYQSFLKGLNKAKRDFNNTAESIFNTSKKFIENLFEKKVVNKSKYNFNGTPKKNSENKLSKLIRTSQNRKYYVQKKKEKEKEKEAKLKAKKEKELLNKRVMLAAKKEQANVDRRNKIKKANEDTKIKSWEINHNKEPKNHKYLAKIPRPDGTFRYIYSKSELDYYNQTHPESDPEEFSNLKKKTTATTPEEDMKNVNPQWQTTDGFDYNCPSCSLAYEMRRRGYDVEATYDDDGMDDGGITSLYKDTYMKDWNKNYSNNNIDPSSGKSIEKKIYDNYGPNARGYITYYYSDDDGDHYGGHIQNFETDDKGHVTIYDGQCGQTFTCQELFSRDFSEGDNIYASPATVMTLRTDNRELNTTRASKYVCNNQKELMESESEVVLSEKRRNNAVDFYHS